MTATDDFRGDAQALSDLDHLDVPALEVLFKLECSAGHLYDLLAGAVGNDEAAELLRRNGREEVGHARRVSRAITIKVGHDYEPAPELHERYPLEVPAVVDAGLLRAVVAGEQAGDADYQRWADNEPDPEVARLLRRNGREETRHGERISQALAILGWEG